MAPVSVPGAQSGKNDVIPQSDLTPWILTLLPGQGANNLPLRGGKNSWFEGGVKTPAFIYSPLFDGSLTTGSDNEWYLFCFRKKPTKCP